MEIATVVPIDAFNETLEGVLKSIRLYTTDQNLSPEKRLLILFSNWKHTNQDTISTGIEQFIINNPEQNIMLVSREWGVGDIPDLNISKIRGTAWDVLMRTMLHFKLPNIFIHSADPDCLNASPYLLNTYLELHHDHPNKLISGRTNYPTYPNVEYSLINFYPRIITELYPDKRQYENVTEANCGVPVVLYLACNGMDEECRLAEVRSMISPLSDNGDDSNLRIFSTDSRIKTVGNPRRLHDDLRNERAIWHSWEETPTGEGARQSSELLPETELSKEKLYEFLFTFLIKEISLNIHEYSDVIKAIIRYKEVDDLAQTDIPKQFLVFEEWILLITKSIMASTKVDQKKLQRIFSKLGFPNIFSNNLDQNFIQLEVYVFDFIKFVFSVMFCSEEKNPHILDLEHIVNSDEYNTFDTVFSGVLEYILDKRNNYSMIQPRAQGNEDIQLPNLNRFSSLNDTGVNQARKDIQLLANMLFIWVELSLNGSNKININLEQWVWAYMQYRDPSSQLFAQILKHE